MPCSGNSSSRDSIRQRDRAARQHFSVRTAGQSSRLFIPLASLTSLPRYVPQSRTTTREIPEDIANQGQNYIIFPKSYSQRPSGRHGCSLPFSTYDLQAMFETNPHIVDPNSNIHIEKAWFFKQKKNPQHELLAFLVRSRVDPTLRNYITLDRNVNILSASVFFKLISFRQNATEAEDLFRISLDQSLQTLIDSCLAPGETYDLLEELAFDGMHFSLNELIVLANTTSSHKPNYEITSSNCYWFASTIWTGILELFSGSGLKPNEKIPGQRGRFKGVHNFDPSNTSPIIEKYKENLRSFMGSIRPGASISSGPYPQVPSGVQAAN